MFSFRGCWHERRTDNPLSLALLASLAQCGWTSNGWLGVICVTIEATWVLFHVLCCTADEVGALWRESWHVSDVTTRWWSYSWFRARRSGGEEQNPNYWQITRSSGEFKTTESQFKMGPFPSSSEEHHPVWRALWNPTSPTEHLYSPVTYRRCLSGEEEKKKLRYVQTETKKEEKDKSIQI